MPRRREADEVDDETVNPTGNVLGGVELMDDQMLEHGPKDALPTTDREGVSRRLAALLALLALALPAVAAQASTPPPLTTHRVELRVLGAPRLFWRWGGVARRLVDPKTRLMRTGTKATCRHLRALSYSCVVSNGDVRLRVVYRGSRSGAFTIRRV